MSAVPRRRPSATLPALVLALALVAVAVVAVHDLASAERWAAGASPWLPDAARALDGLAPAWWTSALGVLVALLGLLLLATGLRPGRRTHQRVQSAAGDVWVSDRAVRRLAETAAERTTGVESATVSVRRRRITVRAAVADFGGDRDVAAGLQENVERALRGFTDRRVAVRTKAASDDA